MFNKDSRQTTYLYAQAEPGHRRDVLLLMIRALVEYCTAMDLVEESLQQSHQSFGDEKTSSLHYRYGQTAAHASVFKPIHTAGTATRTISEVPGQAQAVYIGACVGVPHPTRTFAVESPSRLPRVCTDYSSPRHTGQTTFHRYSCALLVGGLLPFEEATIIHLLSTTGHRRVGRHFGLLSIVKARSQHDPCFASSIAGLCM